MKKKLCIIVIIFLFTFCNNVYAKTSANLQYLSSVVNDSSSEMYKSVDTLYITQEDIKYLDDVDFSKFENIKFIFIEDCYGLDASKIIPNTKVELYISNCVIDLSKLDFSKFEKVITAYTYDIGNKSLPSDIINFSGLLNAEYNIDEKYDDRLNAIAKEIYLKSSSIEEMIENVILYVLNNIEYDDDGIYVSLPKAESIFEHKKGVCSHYAFLADQLLNKLGIFSIHMGGDAGSVNSGYTHAWVIVYLNGEWYGIDPTWMDIDNKEFSEISKDDLSYMVPLADSNSSFNQQHHPSFTFCDQIPINNRISKMSIIENINKENGVTDGGDIIVEVEDTGVNISNISNIIGCVLVVVGLLIIMWLYYLKKRQDIIKVSK